MDFIVQGSLFFAVVSLNLKIIDKIENYSTESEKIICYTGIIGADYICRNQM